MNYDVGIVKRRRMISPDETYFVPSAAGGPYIGPGDIVGSALGWWGLRAYSAAKAGTAAIRLIRASDSAQQDFNTLTNGDLDVASITSFLTSTTGKVVTLYDQTGGGLDLTQGTDAARPALALSFVGAHPAVHFIAANSTFLLTAGTITRSEPFTASIVLNPTSGDFLLSNSGSVFHSHISTNTMRINGNNDFTVTGGSWHRLQAIHNGTSTSLYLDGSNSSLVDSGGGGFSSNNVVFGNAILVAFAEGYLLETGLWPVAFTTGASQQAANVDANEQTYWGI